MASYGEAPESRRKEVPHILRNKNLYLGFMKNTRILGIRIEPSRDELGSSGKETPDIIENPVIVGEWNIHRDHDLPVGMGILATDSKVYMIGGKYSDDPACFSVPPKHSDDSKASLSKSVYEFVIPKLRFGTCPIVPIIRASSSVPLLPKGMPAPIIFSHLGGIYVLSGMRKSRKKFAQCFLVLTKRKGLMEWKSLPAPPAKSPKMLLYGGIGSKIYASVGNKLCYYDINKGNWDDKKRNPILNTGPGALTLSSLSVPISDKKGRPCYVVVSPVRGPEAEHKIRAALVDGDGRVAFVDGDGKVALGNLPRFQDIHEAPAGKYNCLGMFKLIELEEEEKDVDNHGRSSTFALVFIPNLKVIGLTVIRVTLLREPNVDGFLEAEVLLDQRYKVECGFDIDSTIMNDAFLY